MKRSIIIAHLSIWVGFFSLLSPLYFLSPKVFQMPKDIIFTIAISLMFTSLISFYSSSFLIKRFIVEKPKNSIFVMVFFILLIQCIFLLGFFEIIDGNSLIFVFILTIVIILFIILGGVFQFQIAWNNKNNKVRLEMEQQNHESQMALLISQINPHFLFNTLHNIDSLIKRNADKASQSLIKLSEIMRYMIQDTKLDLVFVENEIDHIKNYISLEKLRLKNDKFVNIDIKGNFKGCKIAPMLFIPFIENAFKHSVDSDMEEGISIKFLLENNSILFNCENIYDISELEKDKSHGIGLETVKKRLDLLYKNRHKLSINSNNLVFKVNLKIELNEN